MTRSKGVVSLKVLYVLTTINMGGKLDSFMWEYWETLFVVLIFKVILDMWQLFGLHFHSCCHPFVLYLKLNTFLSGQMESFHNFTKFSVYPYTVDKNYSSVQTSDWQGKFQRWWIWKLEFSWWKVGCDWVISHVDRWYAFPRLAYFSEVSSIFFYV